MFTSKEHKQILNNLAESGLSLTRNKELTKEDLVTLGKEIAPSKKLLEWDFGNLMEMKHEPRNENYLFSDERVPLHWDGAFHQSPAYIIFYCTNISAQEGGETLLANTTELYKALSEQQKIMAKETRLEFTTEKLAHYGGSIEVPLLAKHRRTGAPIMRIAAEVNTEKNPVTRKAISGDEKFCEELDQLALSSNIVYEHQWQKGDLLIVDNDTFLHGRNPLGANFGRSFYRVQAL